MKVHNRNLVSPGQGITHPLKVLAFPLHDMENAHVTTNDNACVDVIAVTSVRSFVGWSKYLVVHRVPPIAIAPSGDDVSKHPTVAKYE